MNNKKKIRHFRRIIQRSSYYRDRIDQMADMIGYWTMKKQIAFMHNWEVGKWFEEWAYAVKQVNRYISKMDWYIWKLEGHWNESLDYES